MCKQAPIKRLKVLSFNVEGLTSELEDPNFVDLLYNHDICLLNETWKSDDSKLNLPNLWDFSVVRQKHKKAGRNSGGVTVLCKEEIRPGVKVSSFSEGFIWLKLDQAFFNFNNPLFLCASYIPPQYSKNIYNNTDYFQNLTNSLLKYSSLGNVMLAGDLNARQGKDLLDEQSEIPCIDHLLPQDTSPAAVSRSSCDHTTNLYGKKLNSLCKSFNLTVANGRAPGDRLGNFTCHTSRGASVVDYIVSDQPIFRRIAKLSILPPEYGSVHSPLSLILKCEIGRDVGPKKAPLPPPPKLIWDKVKSESFKQLLSSAECRLRSDNLRERLIQPDVDGLEASLVLKDITDMLFENAQKCFKLVKRKSVIKKPKGKPWYTTSCHALKKRLSNLAKLLLKKPKDPFVKGKFLLVRKDYRKMLRQEKQAFESRDLEKLQTLTGQPKQFWQHLKRINKPKCSVNNSISSDTWVDHFSSLNKRDPALITDNVEYCKKVEAELSDIMLEKELLPPCAILDEPFSVPEVYHGIKQLKMGKASALDGISNEILSIAPPEFTFLFTLAFSALLKSSHYPIQWATGVIVPLHKSGELDEPNNYRGITLNSCLSKLFTLLLNNRLTLYCEDLGLVSYNQIGFRKGFRTADHVLTLKTIIDQSFVNKKKLYACFVDFRKAYDTVWRNGLFLKLLRGGVSSQFVKLIQDMYSRLQMCVSLQSGISYPFQSNVGLKQGCNLSPLLFNLFINDLTNKIESRVIDAPVLNNTMVSSLLYADDLILLSESRQGLQNSLDSLNEYTTQWFLEVNPTKTKCLVFSRGRKAMLDDNFTLGDVTLNTCDSYCYLGTTFTRSGSFKVASEALNAKAVGAMFSLLRNLYKYTNISMNIMLDLFDRMILPISIYNCEVWGCRFIPTNSNNNKLFGKDNLSNLVPEVLHFRYLKRLLCLPKRTSNWAVLSEAGRYPITLRVAESMIKYLIHVKNTNSHILKAAFETSVKLSNEGHSSWFNSIQKLLTFLNLDNLLLMPDNEINSEISTMKTRLRHKYDTVWLEERGEHFHNSKLELFVSLKEEFGMSPHLVKCNVPSFRSAITKIRTSAHKFPVETGRYQSVPRENRLCPFGCNVVGNESHYMLQCKHPLIEKVYGPIIKDIDNLHPELSSFSRDAKCKFLLNSDNTQTINLVGRLCYKVQNIFKTLTY